MNQSFAQFIYCSPNSEHNFPRNLTAEELITGAFLYRDTRTKDKTVSQLGINALPGTKLYLNGGQTPIIVGFTGLFEIDLSAGGAITGIKVDEKSIREIERNNSAYLIIDVAYWGS